MTTTPGELMLATRDLADAMSAYRNTLASSAHDRRYADRETGAQAAMRDAYERDAMRQRDRALTAWLVAHGWEQPAPAPAQHFVTEVPPAQTHVEQLAWRASHPLRDYDYDGVPLLGTLGAGGEARYQRARRGRR